MTDNLLASLRNREIIVDASSPYVYIGTLIDFDAQYLVLKNVDVHDLRDTPTTRELYVVEARLHGNRPNRKQALVKLTEVVSISELADVIL